VTVPRHLRTERGRHPAPWAPLRRPLAECRLALVASSICLAPAGRGFDRGVQVGDPAFREVAGDVPTTDLLARSRSGADASRANLDRNLAFALDRLREAVAEKRLGELNRRHLALGGAMASTGRAIRKRAPQAAQWLAADSVDVALLVPT
jgi:D-proline reductase (dithiol) PrdB